MKSVFRVEWFRVISLILFVLVVIEPAYAAENAIPFKKDTYSIEGLLYKLAIILLFITALAYGIVYLIKKYYQGKIFLKGSPGTIKVLESKRVSGNLILFRLEINNQEIHLAQSGNNLLVLNSEQHKIEDKQIQ